MSLTIDLFLKHVAKELPTFSQMAYARYLEQEGLRFCVDFGWENAEEIAWDRLERGESILGHA